MCWQLKSYIYCMQEVGSKQPGASSLRKKIRAPVGQWMALVPNNPKLILAPIWTQVVEGLRQLRQLNTYYGVPSNPSIQQ